MDGLLRTNESPTTLSRIVSVYPDRVGIRRQHFCVRMFGMVARMVGESCHGGLFEDNLMAGVEPVAPPTLSTENNSGAMVGIRPGADSATVVLRPGPAVASTKLSERHAFVRVGLINILFGRGSFRQKPSPLMPAIREKCSQVPQWRFTELRVAPRKPAGAAFARPPARECVAPVTSGVAFDEWSAARNVQHSSLARPHAPWLN